jgi:hypothetical protein
MVALGLRQKFLSLRVVKVRKASQGFPVLQVLKVYKA